MSKKKAKKHKNKPNFNKSYDPFTLKYVCSNCNAVKYSSGIKCTYFNEDIPDLSPKSPCSECGNDTLELVGGKAFVLRFDKLFQQ